MSQQTWNEEDSLLYRELAAAAVPEREGLLATLLALVPFGPGEPFRAIELGSGEGFLSRALLEAFPKAEVLALDGSGSMRRQTAARLACAGERSRVEAFELSARDWRSELAGAGLVCSSLCVHHLDDAGKRLLFSDVFSALSPGGALLLLDLVQPRSARAVEVFAEQWDESTLRRSRQRLGHDAAFETFRREGWNHYRTPDPVDRPSSLGDQLRWLESSGFEAVDCFSLVAGHGVYGGYRPGPRGPSSLPPSHLSLAAARRAVEAAFSSEAGAT